MKKATYAPVYAALYPDLAEIAKRHGYALAIHGSLQRDFDLVAIPWAESPSLPEAVIKDITKEFSISVVGEPEQKLHGRLAYTISVVFGVCSFDFSFMPRTPSNNVCSGLATPLS